MVAEEKYNRADPSVTGQVLKLLAAQPDAILIAGSGTPAATPHKELVARGYKGKIYQTHGVANSDFLRVVGKDGDGAILPAGPMLVYEQLPESPLRKSAAQYVTAYESKYGPGSRSTFGGHAWDAYLLLQRALPEALKKAQPGTKAFRAALRDALENEKEVSGANGVFNINPADHNGFDNRARVMVKIENGKWVLIK
jgi:branched-chain amino acid transport system substrate-binding protein